jgi:hypothetical protein
MKQDIGALQEHMQEMIRKNKEKMEAQYTPCGLS